MRACYARFGSNPVAVLYYASDMTDDENLWGLARRVRDGRKLVGVTVIGAVVLSFWLALSSDTIQVATPPTAAGPTAVAGLTPTPTP